METKIIEKNYQTFLKRKVNDLNQSEVDFIGINFEEVRELPVFKCYYTAKRDVSNRPVILTEFYEKNMIHALNLVRDTVNADKLRCEIGLANRNNVNMEWLYKWISSSFELTKKQKNYLQSMKALLCSSLEEYSLAALYFLGFIKDEASEEKLEAVKMHYILRMCRNPEQIGRNYEIDKESVFQILNKGDMPEFQQLSSLAERLLEETNSELWIAAMDFFASKPSKYKIYVKVKQTDFCLQCIRIFQDCGMENMARKVTLYRQWITRHPELKLYGAAICLTEDGKWSINFYH